MLDHIFKNPYQYSATILAKGCVNTATILWSVVVLLKRDALSPFTSYRPMLSVMSEDYWALCLIVTSVIMLYRLVTCKPPRKIGVLAYMVLGIFWANIWWGIVIQPGPFWPAAFGSVTVVLLLSLFAFISNPKPGV
jgi:hypothetical protein